MHNAHMSTELVQSMLPNKKCLKEATFAGTWVKNIIPIDMPKDHIEAINTSFRCLGLFCTKCINVADSTAASKAPKTELIFNP